MPAVRVIINQQQARLLDGLVRAGKFGADHSAVIAGGFRQDWAVHAAEHMAAAGTPRRPPSPPAGEVTATPGRLDPLADLELEPGTGKAVEVPRGYVLRVEQVTGGQCADFNVFNLHDSREAFHGGRTRVQHGIFPTEGDILWSAPPRERPMLTVIADTVRCNDLSFPRCTRTLFETAWGYQVHTNCQDTLAEALREYRLGPDDVHDSFNMWMNTSVDPETGRLGISNNLSQAGDYIELLAHFDVLAAVAVCGADLSKTSNFALRPLRISTRHATGAELGSWSTPSVRELVGKEKSGYPGVKPAGLEHRLRKDPAYQPQWPVYPILTQEVEVRLDEGEHAVLRELAEWGGFGPAPGDVLRYLFFGWCVEHFMQTDPLARRNRLVNLG
jgi:uncharacterized protein